MRKIMVVIAVGMGVLGTGACQANDVSTCRIKGSDADHMDAAERATLGRGLNYTAIKRGGSDAFGVWENSVRVIGYSADEDSVIYSTPACATALPRYISIK